MRDFMRVNLSIEGEGISVKKEYIRQIQEEGEREIELKIVKESGDESIFYLLVNS